MFSSFIVVNFSGIVYWNSEKSMGVFYILCLMKEYMNKMIDSKLFCLACL